jgi:putative endonuclease
MRATQHYVYIATNHSGTLYTGMTHDLEYRLAQHREGMSPFTAKYRIGRLLYFEVAADRYTALEREWAIKRWNRAKKLALIRSVNPGLRDLSRDLGFGEGKRVG